MNDPDKTGKYATIIRSVPRNFVDEGVAHLRHALSCNVPASSIRDSIKQLLVELEQQEESAA